MAPKTTEFHTGIPNGPKNNGVAHRNSKWPPKTIAASLEAAKCTGSELVSAARMYSHRTNHYHEADAGHMGSCCRAQRSTGGIQAQTPTPRQRRQDPTPSRGARRGRPTKSPLAGGLHSSIPACLRGAQLAHVAPCCFAEGGPSEPQPGAAAAIDRLDEVDTGDGLFNPFAAVVGYNRLGHPLRSVESSTQLHLILRPDLARY
jgi:hypothetical protein